MRSLILALAVLLAANSLCLAQVTKPNKGVAPAIPAATVKTVTGTIQSLTPAGAGQGASTLTLLDTNGQNVVLQVPSGAVIHGPGMKPLKLSQLANGSTIQARYHVIPSGKNVANAISVVK